MAGSKFIDLQPPHEPMARRKKTKARVLPPAVMKLNYMIPLNTTGYVSISESVSRMNRRFYRQGLNWAVANVRVLTAAAASPGVGSLCFVNSLPHTWPVANSWNKSFHAWKNQQDDALEEMGGESGTAAFRDFKISMEVDHDIALNISPRQLGPGRLVGPFPTNIPTSAEVLPSEEWTASQVVIPNDGAPGNTVEYLLHMVGPDTATSKGLIAGYELSRSFPQSPDPQTPAMASSWLNEMHDVGDDADAIVGNATDKNDELPYDQDNYPGGSINMVQLETQGFTLNQSTTGINTYNTGPFTAPCGLLRFDFLNQTVEPGQTNVVIITLVPGKHRGYLAETMEEF